MALPKFIRENSMLLVGVSLPAVVVLFFVLASVVPRALVEPPQYDFLFVQDESYRPQPSSWRYEVAVGADQRIRVTATHTEPNQYNPRPRLLIYEHASGSVREVPLPEPETAGEGVAVAVPELANQVLDTRRVAPDGYEVVGPSRGSGDLFGLFYRGNRENLSLAKNGAVFAVDAGEQATAYNTRFLGWIVDRTEP